MRPTCSVVLATYNRQHLLWRSIVGYNNSNFDLSKLEIIIIDDASVDNTQQECNNFDSRIDVKYIKLRKPEGFWRDCASVLNVGLRAANGANILCTHPEVIPGRNSIQNFCDTIRDGTWISNKIYYLSPLDQELIDTVDWKNKGNLAVRDIPDFYHKIGGNPHYTPTATDSVGKPGGICPTWESFVFAGTTRKTWSRLGGFIETPQWGSVDLLLMQRRHKLGILTYTPVDEECICIHQNHDINVGEFKVTDRDINLAHQHAPNLDVRDCGYPGVNHLWGEII